MDASDRPSPRSRQLQGPRPPRLSVTKDSHKIKKPPVAPQPHRAAQARCLLQAQPQQPGAPVIIYDASPKVIHTKPSEFMALVQRLTGPAAGGPAPAHLIEADPSAAPAQVQPQEFLLSPTAALSPAARYAAIERSVRLLPPAPAPYASSGVDVDGLAEVLGPGRPGILSPVPSALPPAASSALFSPLPFDPSSLSWLNDLSPFLPSTGAREAPFAPSPRSLLLATPTMPSPAASSALFSPLPFDPSSLSWLNDLSPFLPSTGAREAPFAPSPRSLLLATPTMPSPATVSVMEFFSNFPDL